MRTTHRLEHRPIICRLVHHGDKDTGRLVGRERSFSCSGHRVVRASSRQFVPESLDLAWFEGRVQLTLENNIVTRTLRQRDALQDRVPCEVLEGLGEYDLAAVRAAYARGRVTTKDLAGMIGRSTRSASTVLKALDTRSVLVWHGTSRNDPAQYYSLGWGHGEISDHFGVTSEPESPTGSRRLLKLQVGMPPVPTSVSNGGSKATSE